MARTSFPGLAAATPESVSRGAALIIALVCSCCGCAKISRVMPCSTSRPFATTSMRSQRPATTPRSCVMSNSDVSSRMSSRRSRICACTVTSSAVVGSSAINRSGPASRADAIIARWRMPPDSSCGKAPYCREASGSPTRASISTTRSRDSSASPMSCCKRMRCNWAPIVTKGFSACVGS